MKRETAQPGSLPKAYDFLLRSPDGYVWLAGKHSAGAELMLALAEIFRFCGYPDEAYELCDSIVKHFAETDLASVCRAIVRGVSIVH